MTTAYQAVILSDSPVSFVPANELSFPMVDIVTGNNSQTGGWATGNAGAAAPTPLGSFAWQDPGGPPSVNLVFTNPLFAGASQLHVSLEFWLIGSTSTTGSTNPFAAAGLMSDVSGSDNDWMLGFHDTMIPVAYFAPAGVAGQNAGGPSLNDGLTHHIVGTWDGTLGQAKLYIDGALYSTATNIASAGPVKGASQWWCGSNSSNWTGSANNFAVYTTTLNAARVLAHYNAGIGASATVPNIVGQNTTDATTLLVAATLVLGTLTYANSDTVAAGLIISQSPVAGTTMTSGSAVAALVSLGPATTVPNVVGLTTGAATTVLASSLLVLGGTLSVFSPTVPVGLIISQSPAAGAVVGVGTGVTVVVSLGSFPSIVPDVLGLSAADANTAIINAGFTPAVGGPVVTEAYAIGDVAAQSPLGGTIAFQGSLVTYSIAVFILPFDPDVTVISQYANSPTLLRLVENMGMYLDPRANLEAFYNYVWNVDTATGFGLDVWGKIVGVSRLLKIVSGDNEYFGFEDTSSGPFDWQNFRSAALLTGGAPFSRGAADTQAYLLPDDAYRTLILTKALSNIVATTAPALNALLLMLFPGRGKVYVEDNGAMTMTFVFEFSLSPVEYAILTQSGALPHPAGVTVNVTVP